MFLLSFLSQMSHRNHCKNNQGDIWWGSATIAAVCLPGLLGNFFVFEDLRYSCWHSFTNMQSMFLNWSYIFLVWKIKFNLSILVHEFKKPGSMKFFVWGNLCYSGCFPHCNYVAFVAIIRVCTAKLSFMITQRLVVENFRKLKTQLVCAPLCKQNRQLK